MKTLPAVLSSALHSTRSQTSTRKCIQNEVSSGVRTALPALCRLEASVIIVFLSPASPASVRRISTRTRLSAFSGLSTGFPYIHLGHLTHERSLQRCSPETIAYTAVDSGLRSGERERGTPPFILGLRRTSRWRSHRCPSWGRTRVILLDSGEIGVTTFCRPITNSIRYLTNHTTTIALCGVPGPRAIGKESTLHTSTFSGRVHSYPRTSLHYLESHDVPRFLYLHTRAVLHSHIEKTSRSTATMTSGSIGTYSIDIGPVGGHTEKGASDLTGFHILLWSEFQLFSLKTTGCKEVSLD